MLVCLVCSAFSLSPLSLSSPSPSLTPSPHLRHPHHSIQSHPWKSLAGSSPRILTARLGSQHSQPLTFQLDSTPGRGKRKGEEKAKKKKSLHLQPHSMSKSTISVFLPVFFSALVICGVVLCTCAYCHRPSFLFFRGGRGSGRRRRRHGSRSSSSSDDDDSDDSDDDDGYSDNTTDVEKQPRPPPPAHRRREPARRPHRRVISSQRVSLVPPSPLSPSSLTESPTGECLAALRPAAQPRVHRGHHGRPRGRGNRGRLGRTRDRLTTTVGGARSTTRRRTPRRRTGGQPHTGGEVFGDLLERLRRGGAGQWLPRFVPRSSPRSRRTS